MPTMLVLDPSYRDDLSFGTSWYVMTLFFNLFFKSHFMNLDMHCTHLLGSSLVVF
jgi:antibiotic biosynthesis monooxygenase (ABM) superfamily enzyme